MEINSFYHAPSGRKHTLNKNLMIMENTGIISTTLSFMSDNQSNRVERYVF